MDPAIFIHFERHDADAIRECFRSGTDPNEIYKGQPLIYQFIAEYTRSPAFSTCIATFVEAGMVFRDQILLAVLLNDVNTLETLLVDSPSLCQARYSLRCAYTPLRDVTLLHICAEFNLTDSARTLIRYGADPNSTAGLDARGFGGQTPVFHTVNQNLNQSADMLHLLLSVKAELTITVKGIIWGEGYEWETFIPSVNPLSYAMMGLLPQMHRNEKTVAETVSLLMKHAYNIDFIPANIPCAYLKK